MADAVLELLRDSDLDEHGHVQGYLWVKNTGAGVAYFHTRERGHGFVRLRPGTYTMEHSTLTAYKDVQCLRPVGLIDRQQAVCLIHPVTKHVNPQDTANALEGCIAPFLVGMAEVAGGSQAAMEQLWRLLGGYAVGKQATLKISNDVPAEAL